jgi:hypothetical protein
MNWRLGQLGVLAFQLQGARPGGCQSRAMGRNPRAVLCGAMLKRPMAKFRTDETQSGAFLPGAHVVFARSRPGPRFWPSAESPRTDGSTRYLSYSRPTPPIGDRHRFHGGGEKAQRAWLRN